MVRVALAFAAVLALLPRPSLAAAPQVLRADLDGDINNITAAYVASEVSRAQSDGSSAFLLVLNTPGGISTSMDDIVTSLLNSKVPVIVYVYPAGARAASAGLFVAQAADVVAMAPGTNIGSAHPIDATGADLTGDLGAKVLNDGLTRVRTLASMHGRNADWAEDAVRHSVNISAEEAVRLHVADLESNDIPSLLATLDNRTVTRPTGTLTIHTGNAIVTDEPMPFWQVFLGALIDPTIAALLLLLASYGIITELTSPGAILPGVVGGIAAVLAVVSLANLPVNIAGALMLIVALGLFIADVKANTHGILSAGGVLALVLGLAFLINTGPIGLGVNPVLLALVVVFSSLRIANEYDRGVVFRLGRLIGLKGPGLYFIIPFGVDRVVRIDLRVITLEVPPQEIITKDNVTTKVNAVLYFQVIDARRAVVQVLNYINATSQISQTTLRAVLGQSTLDELLADRDVINQKLQKIIDDETEPWGIKVTRVEIKDVELPSTMQRAMAKQAEAEREKRAKIINADGEFQASQTLANAAQVISSQQGALQLRFLQTMVEIGSEKNTTIILPLPIELFKPLIEFGKSTVDGSPSPSVPDKSTRSG